MTNELKHPFETANLGIAPFEFVKVTQTKSDTHQYSSCDYCGTAIKYLFIIKSKCGKTFKVGSDCVSKTDYGMYLAGKRHLRDQIRQSRINLILEKRATQEVTNWSEFSLIFPEISTFLKSVELDVQNKTSEFLFSLKFQVGRYGKLSDKQIAAVQKILNPPEKVVGQFVGEIGKYIQTEVTLVKTFEFESQWGFMHIVKMADQNGNTLIYKGANYEFLLIPNGHMSQFKPGEKFLIRGKVKSHTDYKGEIQTVLERIKQQTLTNGKLVNV